MKHRPGQGRENLGETEGIGMGQSTIPSYTIGSKQERGGYRRTGPKSPAPGAPLECGLSLC